MHKSHSVGCLRLGLLTEHNPRTSSPTDGQQRQMGCAGDAGRDTRGALKVSFRALVRSVDCRSSGISRYADSHHGIVRVTSSEAESGGALCPNIDPAVCVLIAVYEHQ